MSRTGRYGEGVDRKGRGASRSGWLGGLRNRCLAARKRLGDGLSRWLRVERRAVPQPDLDLLRATVDSELDLRASGEIEKLLASLENHPFERQRMLVRELRSHQLALLARALCKASRAKLGVNANRARELGLLAAEVVDQLDTRRYPTGLVEDLRGLAWIRIGHAERRASNLVASEAAFGRAEEALHRGSGDDLEWAEYFHALGMLRMDQGKFEEALSLTDRAAALYEGMGNLHSLGMVLGDQGVIYTESGELELSCEKLLQGSLLIDEDSEPRMVLAILHNLAMNLSELGQAGAALALLSEASPLYETVGRPADICRKHWLEGLVLKKRGWSYWRQAAGKFQQAREGFLEHGWVLEATRTILDEALISNPKRRQVLLEDRLIGLLPALRVRGLGQEELATLALLGEEIRGNVNLAAIESAIRTLSRVRLEKPK